ncbi:hypothetical protein CB1_000932084 [Camelus ferus]|nr:hypothetical protein CB1_000932084 [Camelus ferus]
MEKTCAFVKGKLVSSHRSMTSLHLEEEGVASTAALRICWSEGEMEMWACVLVPDSGCGAGRAGGRSRWVGCGGQLVSTGGQSVPGPQKPRVAPHHHERAACSVKVDQSLPEWKWGSASAAVSAEQASTFPKLRAATGGSGPVLVGAQHYINMPVQFRPRSVGRFEALLVVQTDEGRSVAIRLVCQEAEAMAGQERAADGGGRKLTEDMWGRFCAERRAPPRFVPCWRTELLGDESPRVLTLAGLVLRVRCVLLTADAEATRTPSWHPTLLNEETSAQEAAVLGACGPRPATWSRS